MARFFYRHSRGAWVDAEADGILAATTATVELWGEELASAELADDIAVEARLALAITDEIKDVDERITVLVSERGPDGIITSAPGVGAVTGAVILGRLGNVNRFSSLAAVRGFSGLVPSLDASGVSGSHGGPTKRGDALLREALFMAASQARRGDPTLAAKYHRLMVDAGKHHNSALCHIATTLLIRIASCWKNHTPYQLRDVDGTSCYPCPSPRHHRQPIHRAGRHTPITQNKRSGDGPAKQEVAKRSINRPVQHPR